MPDPADTITIRRRAIDTLMAEGLSAVDSIAAVDALTTARMLPTGEEWGALVTGGPHAGEALVTGPDREAVRAHGVAYGANILAHRYTHDWREVGG